MRTYDSGHESIYTVLESCGCGGLTAYQDILDWVYAVNKESAGAVPGRSETRRLDASA